MPKITKIIKPLFSIAITFLIFYLIFQKIDYRSLKKVFLNADLLYLAIAPLVIFLSPIFSAKKWQSMMEAMNYSLGWKESFKIIIATLPVSAITPSKSGDLVKAYYLKNKIPPSQTIGVVVTERLIDISVLALYSFIGALILKNSLILTISLSVILLIFLFFLIINKIRLPFPKWQQKIENFLQVSKIFIHHPQKLLPVLFYTLIFWLIPIFEVKILFLSLGVNISLLYITAAFPLSIFVGLIPITIAGMGIRDSAIVYFFSLWTEPSVCFGVGLLYSFFAYWFLALLGLPVMKKLLLTK